MYSASDIHYHELKNSKNHLTLISSLPDHNLVILFVKLEITQLIEHFESPGLVICTVLVMFSIEILLELV